MRVIETHATKGGTVTRMTREHIRDGLTYDEAISVIEHARDLLTTILEEDKTHHHWLDDCGDYMAAATENWTRLFALYFDNDGDEKAVIDGVKAFLLASPNDWGASDGEIRFAVVDFDEEAWWQIEQAMHKYWEATHPEEVRSIRESDYPIKHTTNAYTIVWESDAQVVRDDPFDIPADVMRRLKPYLNEVRS